MNLRTHAIDGYLIWFFGILVLGISERVLADNAPAQNVVSSATGTVKLKKLTGAQPWDALQQPSLQDGEKLVTWPNSSAVLSLADGSQISVGPNVDMRLYHLPSASATGDYKLSWGKIQVQAKSLMALEAGKNVYQAQNAQFDIIYNPPLKRAHLTVHKGIVSASSGGQTAVFKAGEDLYVLADDLKGAVPVTAQGPAVQTVSSPVTTSTKPEQVANLPAAVEQVAHPSQMQNGAKNFKIDIGAQYDGWDSNAAGYVNGSEVFIPLTTVWTPSKDWMFWAQTEFGIGDYNVAPGQSFDLSHLSDTVVGGQLKFTSFSLPSVLNVAINIPTGDPSWESEDSNSIIPTEFIDSRYRGRGFGLSFLYGFSMPTDGGAYSAAAGYLYSGAFNPSYGAAPSEQLKLGDSLFVSLNRVWTYENNQTGILRASAFYFLPTLQDDQNLLQMGPNFNLSYGWNNPRAFSFEVGAQYYLNGWNGIGGQLVPNVHDLLAPRFYASSGYVFGDFALSAQVKYNLSNGYPTADLADYDGGGLLVGGGPSYLLKLDNDSSLKFSGTFYYVDARNYGQDLSTGDRMDVLFGYWMIGTNYEVKL